MFSIEVSIRLADRGNLIHSVAGHIKEYPVEPICRDARLLRLYEDTTQVQQTPEQMAAALGFVRTPFLV